MWGLGNIIRKRWRGALAVLFGLGLFAAYVVLLGTAAYSVGAANTEGIAIEPQHKARIIAEGLSISMNTTVFGAPLGVLAAALAFVLRGRASRTGQ